MYLNHLVCDLGSNTEGRNLLLILSFPPRDFSPGSPVFPSSKTTISKFQFEQEWWTRDC